MAHMIETMAWTGEKPWHKLGVEVESDICPATMMQAAGLDWEVEKQPLYFDTEQGKVLVDHDALVRQSDGKVLDVVSCDWNPVQNADAIKLFEPFYDSGKLTMETAGSLQEGKIVFFLGKLDREIEVVKGDYTQLYLLLTKSKLTVTSKSALIL